MIRLVSFLLVVSVLVACSNGDDITAVGSDLGTTSEVDCDPDWVVDASEVAVTGRRVEAVAGIILATDRLTDDQAKVVEWSLDRFSQAGLLLPPEIEVVFDQSRAMCHGDIGECRPDQPVPILYVCEPTQPETPADRLNRKLVLLHELGHIWHWSRGDHQSWPDYSAIVGGEYQGDDGTPGYDRTEERVASLISWGLLDQVDRPVLDNMSCEDRYVMFETLTGGPPIGPFDRSCISG